MDTKQDFREPFLLMAFMTMVLHAKKLCRATVIFITL
jgi:hypothetical protein